MLSYSPLPPGQAAADSILSGLKRANKKNKDKEGEEKATNKKRKKKDT